MPPGPTLAAKPTLGQSDIGKQARNGKGGVGKHPRVSLVPTIQKERGKAIDASSEKYGVGQKLARAERGTEMGSGNDVSTNK